MGLFFYNQKGSIISIEDLPTTEIIEPKMLGKVSENVQKTVNSLTFVENRTKIAW